MRKIIHRIFPKKPKRHLDYGHFAKIASKVALVTLAGLLTIFTIHSAIEGAFIKISGNIDELIRPNERLIAVNHLFRNVSELNHILQEEAASGRKRLSLSYFDMSDSIFNSIDSLRLLFSNDSLQLERMNLIEEKLLNREQLLVNYLEVQHQLGTDPGFSNLVSQIKSQNRAATKEKVNRLTDTIHIEKEELEEKEEITEEVEDKAEEKKRVSLWRRIFSKKEEEPVIIIPPRDTIIVDTLKHNEADSTKEVIAKLEKSIVKISTKRQQLAAVLQKQQLELLNTNSFLVQEIISIINKVEQEEIARQNNETRASFITAGHAVKKLNIIAVIFISISIMLFFLIIIDLSNSNKYRKQLELANQRAKDEAEAKQHFLSNMSHEIRTPLQSIYGYAEQAQLNPTSKINISAIYNSASHLLEVVNEVLNYSMVISGKITFEQKRFNPVDEIKSVVEGMQPLAIEKNIQLKFEHSFNKNLNLIGDPFRLRQVLFNVIGNGVKFTELGSVTIKAHFKNPYLIIAVEDTGIGIAESHLDKLFQKYTQTDPSISSKYGGTGLGLSIAKDMVDMQGGEIQVTSKVNDGSVFTMKIPYDVADDQVEVELENAKKDFLSQEVYFADDDPLILNLCSAILKKQGIPHRTFQTGSELIKYFKKHPVPVVFLDMRMPDLNGMEICQQLRQIDPSQETLQIYALTAQVLPSEKEEILKIGFNAIVNKPFKECTLLELLHLKTKEEKESESSDTSVKVDLNMIEKMTGGDEEMMQTILASVIEETEKDLRAIKTAIRKNKLSTVILIIHRLAGRMGQTGAAQLSMQLREMEIILKQIDSTEPVKEELQPLLKMVQLFLIEVETIKANR